MKKKLVLKLGSSTLTNNSDKVSRGKIEDIARQILQLKKEYDIVLVSSGAIATARQFINLEGWNSKIESKQALSAIGQPILMKIYQEVFSDFGLRVGQCLLTHLDIQNEKFRENIINTIDALSQNNYIPIINENDTVAFEEINEIEILGDNDRLSAYVASLMKADLLVLASDIDGLYTKNPNEHKDAVHIPIVNNINELKVEAGESSTSLGTGGMKTKIEAAKICKKNSIEMWIVNSVENDFLLKAKSGSAKFTKFI